MLALALSTSWLQFGHSRIGMTCEENLFGTQWLDSFFWIAVIAFVKVCIHQWTAKMLLMTTTRSPLAWLICPPSRTHCSHTDGHYTDRTDNAVAHLPHDGRCGKLWCVPTWIAARRQRCQKRWLATGSGKQFANTGSTPTKSAVELCGCLRHDSQSQTCALPDAWLGSRAQPNRQSIKHRGALRRVCPSR